MNPKLIKEYRITDAQMDALVNYFFIKEEINNKRRIENIERQFKYPYHSPDSLPIPELEIKFKLELPIEFETVSIAYQNDIYPYISLISDNSKNDLQVYINSIQSDENSSVIEITDQNLKTYTYIYIGHESDKKYIFYN